MHVHIPTIALVLALVFCQAVSALPPSKKGANASSSSGSSSGGDSSGDSSGSGSKGAIGDIALFAGGDDDSSELEKSREKMREEMNSSSLRDEFKRDKEALKKELDF